MERPITQSLIWKCSYTNDTIEGGHMMWMLSTMDENRQEGKQLPIKHKILKWVKTNSASFKGSPKQVPMVNGMNMISPSQLQWL